MLCCALMQSTYHHERNYERARISREKLKQIIEPGIHLCLDDVKIAALAVRRANATNGKTSKAEAEGRKRATRDASTEIRQQNMTKRRNTF
jgi:hypothetical protein